MGGGSVFKTSLLPLYKHQWPIFQTRKPQLTGRFGKCGGGRAREERSMAKALRGRWWLQWPEGKAGGARTRAPWSIPPPPSLRTRDSWCMQDFKEPAHWQQHYLIWMQLFCLQLENFLFTVELLDLQLAIVAFLLATGAFSLTAFAFLLTVGAFLLLTVGNCV